MDTGTAANEARKMKNHFRAFEHLEEVLNEVHAAKGVLSELRTESDKVNVEIKKNKSDLKSMESSLGAFLELEIGKRKLAARDALEIEVSHKDNLKDQKTIFEDEMVERVKVLDERISEREAKLIRLGEQLEAAQGSLGALQNSITNLQSQIKGLQPEV